jgi:hypothetical protein
VKSRCQKFQVQTICEYFESGVHAGRLRASGAGPAARHRAQVVRPDQLLRRVADGDHARRARPGRAGAIIDAAAKFEARINEVVATWHAALASDARLIPTERTIEEEMVI